MIGETIRTEFEALKNDFETIRQQIEDDVVRTELYKGEFYELTPYSYQRNGCKQGKPVKRPDTIKSTKNLCIYGFNNQNQIVEVKVGCSIENQFYHTFLYYTDNLVKSILYDNGKHLMNVCHYFFEGGKLKRSQLCGRYGCREENYKGEFYEISPYSYQRNRFKQGKIVGNVTSLKTTSNLFTYYFDVKNQIIEIREGLELKNQFYYTFFIYEKELMKTIAYDNSKRIVNVRYLSLIHI